MDNCAPVPAAPAYGRAMQLHLTVVPDDGSPPREVEVVSGPGRSFADLAAVLDLDPASVRVGDGLLEATAVVGEPPLLDGAVLVAGAAARGVGGGEVAKITTAPLALAVVAGPDAGRALPLTHGRHRVGRSPGCDLRIDDDGVSRVHAEVVVDREGVRMRDLEATNPSRLAGTPLLGTVPLSTGDELLLGASTLRLVPTGRARARRTPTGQGSLLVSPRPVVSPADVPTRITYPARPTAPRRRRMPWVVLLVPLPLAAVLALVLGPRMLLFALLSPLLMMGSVLGDRSTSRREHRDDLAAWRAETRRATERTTAAVALERAARHALSPDPLVVLAAARGENDRLWERRRGSAPFLHVRVGIGEVPSRVEVDEGVASARLTPPVPRAPVTLDLLAAGVVGIAGARRVRTSLARWVLGQVLGLHSPHEVHLWVVADDEGLAPFRQAPHLRDVPDDPGSSRYVCHAEAGPLLARLARQLADRAGERGPADDAAGPVHVLVVDAPDRLRGDEHLRELLTHGPEHRVIVLGLGPEAALLPHETRTILTLDDGAAARVSGPGAPTATPFVRDGVRASWAERLGTALTPLRDATPAPGATALPRTCRLVDLLDIDPDDTEAVLRRWSRPPARDLAVPIGTGGDGTAWLDLVTDGPHALLAGTTGSGKSELLQTWICSLALHRSPDDVSFVLVDYKGGAAFAACSGLPHTVGMLTDLEPHHARRALASLDAELTRRERLLHADGAKDVDDYAGPTPLPRLLIVVDEFRMLAEQQPEILAGLVRIAAVGRSLGVHLVLATQRPGGIVSADVRANVNLRLSLRVRDRTDSDDVLGCPDAAEIDDRLPGRLLLGRGSARPLALQTARVGGHAPSADTPLVVRPVGSAIPAVEPAPSAGPTDLERLTRTVRRAAVERGTSAPHRPWLPPLAPHVDLSELPGVPTGDLVQIGLRDEPEEQAQSPLTWSPASGHWMVVGAPGSGRTTTLRSLAVGLGRLGAARAHVHLVGDGSAALGGLTGLRHVGSVVDADDRPTLRRLLTRLRAEVEERRRLLRAAGHGDLEAWPAGDSARPPYLVLGVDGWARVAGSDVLGLDDTAQVLESLVRDGGAVGLRLVVTGGRELLGGRLSSMVTTRLVLHLPDRGDAALAGVPLGVLPEHPVPGRAVVLPGGHVVQVAVAGVPAAGRSSARVDEGAPRPSGAQEPWAVTALPEQVDAGALPGAPRGLVPLGLSGGHEIAGWSPDADGRRFLVAGPHGSGRTVAARRLAAGLAAQGRPTVLLTDGLLTDGRPTGGLPEGEAPARQVRVLPQGDDAGLLALRRAHDDLAVVVDDADRVEGTDTEQVLREIVRRVDQDRGVVVVVTTTTTATTQLRGLVAEVARSRLGLLLQPSARQDGDALGTRVPPLDPVPGRGYLVARGTATEVQVAAQPSGGVRGGASRREPVASKAQPSVSSAESS